MKLRNFILNGGDTLGICLGMQILYKSSEESKDSNGIGIIKRKIKKLVRDKNLSIPHVGWNKLIIFKNSKNGLINIIKNDRFYFSHSLEASFWMVVFVSVNLFQIVRILNERRKRYIEPKIVDLYKTIFNDFSSYEFLYFWKIGKLKKVSSGKVLINEGDYSNSINLILD